MKCFNPTRLSATLRIGVLACALLSGCSFADGDPWGSLTLEPTVSMEIPSSRLTPEGYLKTSSGFAVQLDTLSMELDAITIAQSDLEGAALSFDPASPPAGYSLCHNGHCHAADGRLVDYEDIEAELATGSAQDQLSVAILNRVELLQENQALNIDNCTASDPCALDRTRLSAASMIVRSLRVRARVFDLRAEPTLPTSGVPIALDLSLASESPFSVAIDVVVDDGEPLETTLKPSLEVSEKLFDGITWDALATHTDQATPFDVQTQPEWVALISSKLYDESGFFVDITRN